MNRFLRALLLSAAATAVVAAVTEALTNGGRSRAQRTTAPRAAERTADPADELDDTEKEALISEFAAHV